MQTSTRHATGRRRHVMVAATAAVLGLGGLAASPSSASIENAATGAASTAPTIRLVVGPDYVDPQGNTWKSATGYRGGRTAIFDSPIAVTAKDPLYQRERYGLQGLEVPVSSAGTYRTTLNLAELWFTGVGQRVFDVSAEGTSKLNNVDIFAQAGGMNKPLQLSFDTQVTDGVLTLDFTDRVNYAKVDSIRVEKVAPAPPAASFPKLASIQTNAGESWADACIRTMTYGYTGCVRYRPLGTLPAWDSTFQELAAKAGGRRVDIQLTAKTHSHAGLAAVLSQVPTAWKPTFMYNIYQEPEDNLTTLSQQAAYRADYSDAATVTREYGFQLPWLELQEWGVNPGNNQGWNTAGFFPPARDYQGVLWSLFEFNQRDVLTGQVNNISAAMTRFAPGKPWALMAAEYCLPASGITVAKQQAQGAWLARAKALTSAAGSQGFAWFNLLYNNGAGLWEGRVEVNPYALSALQTP